MLNVGGVSILRDPNRIKPFLENLEKLWLRYPDYRFGQLIYLLAGEIGQDIFFPEEGAWINAIERLIAEYDEYERNNPKIEYKDVDLYEIVEELMNLKNTNKYKMKNG